MSTQCAFLVGHDRCRHPAPLQGFTLVEMSVVLVIAGLISWALTAGYAATFDQRDRDAARRHGEMLQTQIHIFALTHQRLPCPAANTSGYEDLSAGNCQRAVGYFPYVALGLDLPTAPLHAYYAVYRQANATPTADADLAVRKERTGDSPGDTHYQDVYDLIAALNNLAGRTPNNQYTYLVNGTTCGSAASQPAYWLILPLEDRDGNGQRLDAPHSATSWCAVDPAVDMSPVRDDVVLAASPAALTGWLKSHLP